MPTYIKPSLTITANKNSVSTNKGPLSIPLSLSKAISLSVDDVRSRVLEVTASGITGQTGAEAYRLFDGDRISGGDGAAGTVGCFIYLSNISAVHATNEIYVGIDHDGGGTSAGDMSEDDQVDAFEKATRMMTLKPGEFGHLC